MQAEQIAKSLGNAKRANGQWVASCPVPSHGKGNGDKNPSLSVHIDDEGKPLFHCHGGCTQESVFQTIRDMQLLPELEERPDPLANIKPLPKVEFQQEWQYQDEDRVTVFVKHRLRVGESGKTYRLYKVDTDGKRSTTLGDARIVPYKLPELLDAKTAGRIIYLAEGEKAVDALMSLGVVATTAHSGAGHWPEAITEYFAGANVVILPDNDLSGWSYARKAAEAILPIAKALKVVDLGLQEQGDDAYEFIEAGGGRAELAALVKAAPKIISVDDVTIPERLQAITASSTKTDEIYTSDHDHVQKQAEIAHEFAPDPPKEVDKPKPTKTIKIESWDTIQDEPVEWLIEGVIPKGSFTALYGPPGSFKSFIALDIAEAIATGRTWMGKEVKQTGAVLYLAGEGFGGIGARIKACKMHHQTEDGAPIYIVRHQLNLRSSAEDFNALMMAVVTLVEQTGMEFSLAIVDTLARAFGGGNENSSEDMGAFITAMGKVQEFLNCALMVLHHSGKDAAKGLRGHSSLLGAVDTELELLRFDEQMKGVLTISKQKDGADNERFGFEMVEVEIRPAGLGLSEPVVSLAVQASDSAKADHAKMTEKKPPANKDGGKWQPYELPALYRAIKNKGFDEVVDGVSMKVVNIDDWKEELKLQASAYDATKTQINNAIWTAKGRLKVKNLGGHHDKVAWLNQDVMTKMATEAAYKFNN
jgi:RecA/RadA recombinase